LVGEHTGITRIWGRSDEALLAAAERVGISMSCASVLTTAMPAPLADFQECNRQLAAIVRRYPDKVRGYCYVNPGYTREALREIRHYVDEHDFMGIKLYNEYKCTDPILYPIVELAIELGVPILHHAGHAHRPVPAQPNISDSGDLAILAARYPEAIFICAHIGGGGDWEWTIKAARATPSIYLDTSGSVFDSSMVQMAVRVVGAERVLFGCDTSFTAGVGKIRAANLTDDQRALVMGGNMQRILAMRRS
jgi:hypothetical protein